MRDGRLPKDRVGRFLAHLKSAAPLAPAKPAPINNNRQGKTPGD